MALHMHQPLIPAGAQDLCTAEIISNLKYMLDHRDTGDSHNAPRILECYKRMGEFIPQLIHEGKQPRVMLEYSGTLLYGLAQMGRHDVLDQLRTITCDPLYRHAVEWLGAPWGHAVAPSTPAQDYRLHVRAWQHCFAATFGLEALSRVRGFSPSEMALPNHPDIAYEFVKTLRDCGLGWVLVQEHTVEQPATGAGPERKHIPHRLVCRNSHGDSASIMLTGTFTHNLPTNARSPDRAARTPNPPLHQVFQFATPKRKNGLPLRMPQTRRPKVRREGNPAQGSLPHRIWRVAINTHTQARQIPWSCRGSRQGDSRSRRGQAVQFERRAAGTPSRAGAAHWPSASALNRCEQVARSTDAGHLTSRAVGHYRSIIMGPPAHGLRAGWEYGTSALR